MKSGGRPETVLTLSALIQPLDGLPTKTPPELSEKADGLRMTIMPLLL